MAADVRVSELCPRGKVLELEFDDLLGPVTHFEIPDGLSRWICGLGPLPGPPREVRAKRRVLFIHPDDARRLVSEPKEDR